jgi:phospholipase/carboxylesterase
MDLIHTLYEPPGAGPHPTILTLHGWGANAMDLLGLAPYLCGGRFLIICPQGPVQTPIGPNAVGYGWYPSSRGGPPDIAAMLSVRQRLLTFLDQLTERYPIDRSKMLLLGFSQGGVMAYNLALAAPAQFAGLVALSTWLPPELLDHLPGLASANFPTLIQHGTNDELVSVERARKTVETLREQQLPLTYREYDMGHEINSTSLLDLSDWLQEHLSTSSVTT